MNFILVLSVFFATALAQEKEGYKFEIQHEHPHIYQHVQNHGVQKEAAAVNSQQNDNKHVAMDTQQHHETEHYVDYMGYPKYHFDYAVHDPHTHDIKNQWEMRDGKHVKGEYKVVQPDGKTRVVQYESNGHGTNYHVKYEDGHY